MFWLLDFRDFLIANTNTYTIAKCYHHAAVSYNSLSITELSTTVLVVNIESCHGYINLLLSKQITEVFGTLAQFIHF